MVDYILYYAGAFMLGMGAGFLISYAMEQYASTH